MYSVRRSLINSAATVPLLKGKEYLLYYSDEKNIKGTATFVPFVDNYSIGEGEPRKPGTAYGPAETDGFLVARLKDKKDGARARVKMLQNKNLENLDQESLSIQASTSIHRWKKTKAKTNTAFMPVMKDNFYRADYKNTGGASNISLTFYSLTKDSGIEPEEPL